MKQKTLQMGLLVGRFQAFHTGHEMMVNTALGICERVGIFVGSSQESGTAKNPFTYETRVKLLRAAFGNGVEIYPLPDIGVGNNGRWGDYVLQNAKMRFGRVPDLLISGKEERRVDWFDGAHGVSVAELYIPKTIDISATQMRQFLIDGNEAAWRKYTGKKLWDSFSELRAAVLASKDNQQTASL